MRVGQGVIRQEGMGMGLHIKDGDRILDREQKDSGRWEGREETDKRRIYLRERPISSLLRLQRAVQEQGTERVLRSHRYPKRQAACKIRASNEHPQERPDLRSEAQIQ